MPSHTRGKGRGSISMLSLDYIRSSSPAGSSQAATIPTPRDLRQSSSRMSYCDPSIQPPARPVNFILPVQVADEQHSTSENHNGGKVLRSRPRTRPLSWFPFDKSLSTYKLNGSDRFRMLKDPSSTSLAKSAISDPVLTSTTNVKLARLEGVHCGELTPENFETSTWDSKIGWIRTKVDHEDDSATTQARLIAKTIAADPQHTITAGQPPKKLRCFVKERFRGRVGRQCESLRSIHQEDQAASGYGTKLARYKAETVSLCKCKIQTIKRLTSIHSRSHSTSMLEENVMPGAGQTGNESPLLIHKQHSSAPNANFHDSDSLQLPIDCETFSQFDSLTRSLNSILDDGFRTLPIAMSYIKNTVPTQELSDLILSELHNSQVSFEIMDKVNAQDGEEPFAVHHIIDTLPNRQLSDLSATDVRYNSSSKPDDEVGISKTVSAQSHGSDGDEEPPSTESDDASDVKHVASTKLVDGDGVRIANFTGNDNEISFTESKDGNGVNGLSMHPNVMAFAHAPMSVAYPQFNESHAGQLHTTGDCRKPNEQLEKPNLILLCGHPQKPQGTEAKAEVGFHEGGKRKRLAKSTSQWFKTRADKVKIKLKRGPENERASFATATDAVRLQDPR